MFIGMAALAAGEVAGASAEIGWLNSLAEQARLQAAMSAQQKLEASIPGLITSLPAGNPNLAWTIDDASDAKVLGLTLDRIAANNLNLTLFVNSSKGSFKIQAEKLNLLIKTAQVQLGNHSHNHFDLTTLTNAEVKFQLQTCHNFLLDEFGVDARPYWRPPFRRLDQRVAAVAADLGYTTPTLWNKNLLNASPNVKPVDVLARFKTQAIPGAIMLDHMHGLVADADFAEALAMLQSANLKTVTLNQAFGE